MFWPVRRKNLDKDIILNDLIRMLSEISSGWEMEFSQTMGPRTLLGTDLGLKSIDIVKLVAAIQQQYGRKDLPFHDLFMPDDRPVKDLAIADLADFLGDHLND